MSKKPKNSQEEPKQQEDLPEYLRYPADEDIYNKEKKDRDIDPDSELPEGKHKYKSPGDDLDIPGTELDDADEEIGEEDEENNYYSLGGDDHDDLEEDRGDD